jgi:streptomycin 6-kinase
MRTIPPDYARFVGVVFGDEGTAWIAQLPSLIAQYERRWSLTVGEPYALSYNYVAPAVRADGTPVVLKMGVPHAELRSEIEALRWYDGHGIVQIYEADIDGGAFVLERLTPGTMLIELEDDAQATDIAADVMAKVWRPAPASDVFPTLHRWFRSLVELREQCRDGTTPFDAALVERAYGLFRELIASQPTTVLLHGDVHHENIARAQREPWLALDPKGIVGDPTYEVATYLCNPMQGITTWPDLPRVLRRRIDQFHDRLGLDRERMRGWGIAHAILSAAWTYETGEIAHDVLAVAQAL